MMRKALLWVSTNAFLAQRLPQYGFVKRATRRFMPGEALGDALDQSEVLAGSKLSTTVTLLGENLASVAEADTVVEHYFGVLSEIAARGLNTEISIKPTQLGLDFGAEDAQARLEQLLAAASSTVWIDMEGSDYVDATLAMFRAARGKYENVGLCLQAYLHRTKADLEALLPLDPSIRLVKGAYNEPPAVAYPRKADVDQNFVRLTVMMLKAKAAGGKGRPVLGTHDPRMVGEATRMAHSLGLPKGSYEFAMLYGIEREQQERLARGGHAVRVLVSYGSAWFPWYIRRLAERPANVWFVVKQIVR